MAAVEVTISGMLYDKINRTTQNVVLIGEATLTGLGVGGGPIVPPPGGPQPPWPDVPKPPVVTHPIWPPTIPGGGPILPPTEPPTEPPQPPGSNWEWVWSPQHGWHVGYVPGDKPEPPPA